MSNRLDKELVERNMVPSRTKAQELITNKKVLVNGKTIDKSNYKVNEIDDIVLEENDVLKYVSRGGLKLEKAIKEFDINLEGLSMMDIGSSTGGFSDCALQNKIKRIVAVDVGTNLMNESLRNNPKIDLHEKTNIKELEHKYFEGIDFISVDVSFISLARIIEIVASHNIKVEMMCLIKPQFECGKEAADKYKGVILNKEIHREVLINTIKMFNEHGFYLKNIASSPIRGGDGNIEYISYISNKENENIKINIEEFVGKTFRSL